MYTTNEWYIFTGTVNKQTCNSIKTLGKNNFSKAVVSTKKCITDGEREDGVVEKYGIDDPLRKSEVVWLTDQWLYDLIWPYMLEANANAGWRYHIKSA